MRTLGAKLGPAFTKRHVVIDEPADPVGETTASGLLGAAERGAASMVMTTARDCLCDGPNGGPVTDAGDLPYSASRGTNLPSVQSARTAGAFWRVQIIGWLFWALFGLISRAVVFQDMALALTLTAILEPLGFAFTTLAHHTFRNRIGRDITLTVIAVALALSVAGGLLQMLVANMIKDALPWSTGPRIAVGGEAIPVVYYTLIFLGWSLAYLWIKADANAHAERIARSRAQQAVLQAELHRLRLQLDSHLLFNALNTVAMEIPDAPDTALEMTHRIAGYLRYSLNHPSRRVCPLTDELEAMRAYVRIHELRFESDLDCIVDMEQTAESITVPHLILQPLVENAVKHGVRSPAQRFTIAISVEHKGDDLVIEVRNPGRLTMVKRDRPGVGLENTRRRLELHYPLCHELSLTETDGTVVARLKLSGQACFVW